MINNKKAAGFFANGFNFLSVYPHYSCWSQDTTTAKNDRAALSKLTGKVINGGAGNWGQIPMTPHPQLSKKDAAEMVRYILSLKK